jgi:FkbM family methyltransferase
MNESTKGRLRQIIPPILLPLGKKLLSHCESRFARTPETAEVSALKAEHERRNASAAANEVTIRDGLSLQIHPDSRCAIDPFCYSSPISVKELDSFIELTIGKRWLLDIGALHGVFSLVFAANHPERKVVAVDASPIAFARLLYNIHKNSLFNVKPIECGLSDSSGTLCMHYEWEHAVAANTNAADRSQNVLSVTRRTGDELCDSLSFVPDVIKIDVEGHEIKVVKGLSHIISRSRPLIFLELHPDQIRQERDDVTDLVSLLEATDYRASLPDGSAVLLRELVSIAGNQRLVLTPS